MDEGEMENMYGMENDDDVDMEGNEMM